MERASFTCSVLNNTSRQELLEKQNKKFYVDLSDCGYLQCLSINISRYCLPKKL